MKGRIYADVLALLAKTPIQSNKFLSILREAREHLDSISRRENSPLILLPTETIEDTPVSSDPIYIVVCCISVAGSQKCLEFVCAQGR
jgi:hypothetical protein